MDKEIYRILKHYYGYSSFRRGQKEIIESILHGNDVLSLMPTGGGKSICYQIPALIFDGITIVISPLISLMKDQVRKLNQIGIRAAYINSSLSSRQIKLAMNNMCNGFYKIIYVAPERLLSKTFIEFAYNTNISLIAVDEAHCISQWGHDFRPSYTKIDEFVRMLNKRPVIAAFTATATEQVKEDIIHSLNLNSPLFISTGFNRENLFFSVEHVEDKTGFIINYLKINPEKSGIIYCLTRRAVDTLHAELVNAGYMATKYHAGLIDCQRKKNQDDFILDKSRIMVATNAFGMGIDKPNVSFVIHNNMPMNVEQYYQEAGRAGRDGQPADCILLYANSDYRVCEFMIESSKEEADELTDIQRARLKKSENQKLSKMAVYCNTSSCLRKYILNYFGEKLNCECQGCSNCTPKPYKRELNNKLIQTNIRNDSIKSKKSEACLFNQLSTLRKKLAALRGVPAYTIFSNITLRELSTLVPKNVDDLRKIKGMNPWKIERYAGDILKLTKDIEKK